MMWSDDFFPLKMSVTFFTSNEHLITNTFCQGYMLVYVSFENSQLRCTFYNVCDTRQL